MLEVGSIIDGKYKILSEIGRGGMSVVYMALNEKANKTWAIKEVRKGGQVDFESVRQGLIVETEMLKNLKHPNLPSIIDVIDQGEIFLIVMDYIEGVSLSKALSTYGVQPQEVVVDWARQLCDVLGYLHNRPKPIIYRDLKPQNVMLKPDGTLTLIDFGTAREFKESNIEDTTCLGTIGYAAPEQYGGQGQTDARTDIYCLGATLYHLITGLNPSEPPYEMRPIRQANPALSGGLERIIAKCIQKDPALRYQSCAELMYDLEHYEEIDEAYLGGLRSKITAFILVAAMSVLSLTAGIVFSITAVNLATDTYQETVEAAKMENNYNSKMALFQEAIEISGKSGNTEAYLEIIQAVKEDDYVFNGYASTITIADTTYTEEGLLTALILNNKKAIIAEDSEAYAALCFEMGRLYWYYYSASETANTAVPGMTSAIEWFDLAVTYAAAGDENSSTARAYADIGKFYRDITISANEANDAGLYLPFYENLAALIQEIAYDETESEIVRLEILSLARSAIKQYTTQLKRDGVTEAQLTAMLDDVETLANQISMANEAPTEKVSEKLDDILTQLADTRASVELAYAT